MVLLLAAGTAGAHDEVVLPDLPIPDVERIFPVDDVEAASHWSGNELYWHRASSLRWHVVELSEGQFLRLGELLDSIQETLDCEGTPKRFSLRLRGDSRGGVELEGGQEVLGTDITRKSSQFWGDWLYEVFYRTTIPTSLVTRFTAVWGRYASDTALRDTGMDMVFRIGLTDHVSCIGEHTNHSNGSPRHDLMSHNGQSSSSSYTDWIPIADLLDGTVSVDAPADPDPEEPEPEAPADQSAELARLRAENADLQSDLSAVRGDLSTVRDSVDALLAGVDGEIVTLYDTVLVSHTDTLLFCPPSDDDRRDLFDLFTGVADDSTETEGPAGKAAVKIESWGAIKALVGSDAN